MPRTKSKLALGSANFGLDYGLSNHGGKISKTELEKILTVSEAAGVEVIDTAQAYGDSEGRIGALCDEGRFKIITKLDIDLEKGYIIDSTNSLVKQSLITLNQSRLYAVLLHRPEILLGEHGHTIIKELQTLKDNNIISKIGISIYSPQILTSISKLVHLDIVQVPFNIFDQQILSSGWNDKLKESGIEIHARSAFLQGLLITSQSKLNKYFTSNWPDLFDSWYEFLKTNRADPLNVALKFVLKQHWVDKVVVGVDDVLQLKTLLAVEKSLFSPDFPQLSCEDINLVNPSKWDLL